MLKLFIFLLFFTNDILTKPQICILIHGTWASTEKWCKENGDFYETLKYQLNLNNIKLINFNWSGTLSYEKRQEAGLNLMNLINSYPTKTKFIIVAHSHGGNVGIIASQYLKQRGKIKQFYALGTPIDMIDYLPNMNVIQNFYNIFSFGDLYQTVLGMHQRFLPPMPRIYNLNIEIENQKPGHQELHCSIIAKWLPHLPLYLKSFDYDNHFFAKFYANKIPTIELETNLDQKLAHDLKMYAQMSTALTDLGNGRRPTLLCAPTNAHCSQAGLKYHL